MSEMHMDIQEQYENWSQADEEEAHYNFVLMEFKQLIEQYGVNRVASDINKMRHEYKYKRGVK